MRDFSEEFLRFIKSYGVIGIAIGIVMGQAVAKMITVIVEGLVMPILEVLLPGNRWQEAVLHLWKINIKIGLIIAAFIDFFIISAVVFFFFKYILRVDPNHKR
jgi:large conductance mechanosensitive channel